MRSRARSEHAARDEGAVTAELALAMPVLLATLGLALWAVAAAGLRMDCTDAARAAARAAARGDSEGTIRSLVERTGPRGAQLDLERRDGLVTVTVRTRTTPPGPFGLPAFTVGGSAVAEVEGAD